MPSLASRKLSDWARKNTRTVMPSGSCRRTCLACSAIQLLPDGLTVLGFFLAQPDNFLVANDSTCT